MSDVRISDATGRIDLRRHHKRSVRDAFYTDTDEWKQRIVQQGTEAARQALAALAAAIGSAG